MQKILEQNGYKYSREKFEGYKFRAKFEFEVKDQKYTSNIDIYTTDPDRTNVYEVIGDILSEKVLKHKIINWTTKEQDELTAQFIEESLKD